MARILPISPHPLFSPLPNIDDSPGVPVLQRRSKGRGTPPAVHLSTPILAPRNCQCSHGSEEPCLRNLSLHATRAPPDLS